MNKKKKMECKAKMHNGKKCYMKAVLDGYCTRHFRTNHKLYKGKPTINWKKEKWT